MKSKMPQIGEAIFCILYLIFDLIAAFIFLTHINDRLYIQLFGILTLTLGGGDAFHLVPRIINAFKDDYKQYEYYAGLGLFVSSVTMTIFYILLFYIHKLLFPTMEISNIFTYGLWFCALLRIALCFFPQNNWFKKEGNSTWGIYRNVPFVFVGLIMIILFIKANMWNMALAILISFGCYLPVVLYGKKNPKIGMLMIPKTIAYIWMISIGLAHI